jgi:hypothetical protein
MLAMKLAESEKEWRNTRISSDLREVVNLVQLL